VRKGKRLREKTRQISPKTKTSKTKRTKSLIKGWMDKKGKHALCAKVHLANHSPTRTGILLLAAENSEVV
jgi:hypothetical protein